MVSAWKEDGPVSTPPRSLAYGAGAALVVLAFVGVGMGMRAAWRESNAPDLGGTSVADAGDVALARPIVQLPPPPVAANAADNAADNTADEKTDAIQMRTAEAQQVQSTASKSGQDIDQILTSPTERPPGSSKSGADESAPPGPPVKSDVPF